MSCSVQILLQPLSCTSIKSTAMPVQLPEIPVKLTETPVKLLEILVKLTETPVKLTDIPIKLTEIPIKLTDIPINLTDKPMNLAGVIYRFHRLSAQKKSAWDVYSDRFLVREMYLVTGL